MRSSARAREGYSLRPRKSARQQKLPAIPYPGQHMYLSCLNLLLFIIFLIATDIVTNAQVWCLDYILSQITPSVLMHRQKKFTGEIKPTRPVSLLLKERCIRALSAESQRRDAMVRQHSGRDDTTIRVTSRNRILHEIDERRGRSPKRPEHRLLAKGSDSQARVPQFQEILAEEPLRVLCANAE